MRGEMSCEQVLHELFAYLDRESDAPTAAQIGRHLQACRGCFSRAQFELKLKGYLRAAGQRSAPQRLRARVKDLVDKF